MTASSPASLRDALSLAYDEPEVAAWLFGDKDHAYMDGAMPVAPTAFKKSLSFRMFNHFDRDSEHSRKGDVYDIPPSADRSNLQAVADKLITPVCKIGDVLVGYMMVIPVYHGEQHHTVMPLSAQVMTMSHINGRFAYDKVRKTYLVVMNAVTDQFSVVVSLTTKSSSYRTRCFFVLENRQYTYPNLPMHPIAIITNLEYEIGNATDTPPSVFKPAEANSFLEWLCRQSFDGLTLPTEPLLTKDDCPPWSSSSSSTAVALPPPLPPPHWDATQQLSGATGDLRDMEATVLGQYYAPHFRRDGLDPTTGAMCLELTGRLRADLYPTARRRRTSLIDFAASCYYRQALGIATGRVVPRIHCRPDGVAAPPRPALRAAFASRDGPDRDGPDRDAYDDDEEQAHSEEHTPSSQGWPQVLMPVRAHAHQDATRDRTGEERVSKLELKRRRNRMSAARSNIKRKLREEEQAKELEFLKSRVTQLRQLQAHLADENMRLRIVTSTS